MENFITNYKSLDNNQLPNDEEICVVSDETGMWYLIAGWDNANKAFVNEKGYIPNKYRYWIPLNHKLPNGEKQTSLSYKQKLEALSLKFYSDFQWEPKKLDYYTNSRNDLELYQIVDEDENYFYTNYCDEKQTPQPEKWEKEKFLKDFGERRVFVPSFIFEM